MTDAVLPSQEPPSPPRQPAADTAGAPEPEGETTARGPLHRVKLWMRYIRIRIAHAVLLPELSPSQARALRRTVHEDSELTSGYVLMSALSAGIATLGLLQSSTAVVIGAMLISPLMSPIAALGFAFASVDGKRIREAARVVLVGAAVGVLTGVLLTWLSPIRNATPEILARTQPTLLDLAVALFSGIAGGYATVIQKGGTAIGVAIATALMPPLATIGYGVGMLHAGFALGALLLFATNLAAIAFAFALIARLSGAARPLTAFEWRPRYVTALVLAFLALAIPLSMTLMRLKEEATMRTAAQAAILEAANDRRARIAQIDVVNPLFGEPSVEALVITPAYAANATRDAERRLENALGEPVSISLQQVLAADLQSQTRAMVDAAMERTMAGIAADVPPLDKIRASVGLPTRSIWSNRAGRMVYVEPIPAPGWTLADYREVEREATDADEVWAVRVVPPAQQSLRVAIDPGVEAEGAVSADLAVWALQRWGMSKATLIAPEGGAPALAQALREAGIRVVAPPPPADGERGPTFEEGVATLRVYAERPTLVAARKAAAEARAAAERAAAAEAASAGAVLEGAP
ncbi:hypothetical protein GCM10011371_29280 [Novosphingobium marinum]|uniref:Putative hydrophobic protein (TIGR00271 family) n=1 Tax=Novosphingobium marinum TaxID=1514948 RepID=A0A7Y9Y0N0_9SPHN|nr:DUF389 domain-containing protein [Novosphingobium marinum]NYH96810.1 putative hydrophobic protein (TIGR00271 family) [Novosphingobium marinum]GGC40066.1 hypothetical protein GCM10011371_29280 [Novosphingobium marinum]